MTGEIINILKDFISNKKISIGKRLSYIISILVIVLFIDLNLDISYSWYESNKVENIKTIRELRKDYSNNSKKINYLDNLEEIQWNKRHYSHYLISLKEYSVDNIPKLKFWERDKEDLPKIINESETLSKKRLSFFWTAISSSFVLILTIIILILTPIYKLDFSIKSFTENLSASVIAAIVLLIITVPLSFIPVLGFPIINYLLYFIMQIGIIYLFMKSINE